ncbi:MAG: response regulator, partial [Chthoniobacterales bacterium]
MKILLVEDNPDSRRNLRRLIEKRGHEVTACATAEEAEAEIAKDVFPLVILDWMLPGKSGIELCRSLRLLPSGDERYILLVTARANAEDLEEAMNAGANDYLAKPFEVRRLNVRLTVAERHIQPLQERNAARGALLEAAQRTADIIEKTSDGFASFARDWNFTHLTVRAGGMLSRSRDELIGRHLW